MDSLQQVQAGWKEERERLSLLVDEVQQAAMQKSEAEQQVNELQAVQITRLHEVESNAFDEV